jgi:hypothetical protein
MNPVAPKAQVGRTFVSQWVGRAAGRSQIPDGFCALTRTGVRTATNQQDRTRQGLSEMPRSVITAQEGAPALWRF